MSARSAYSPRCPRVSAKHWPRALTFSHWSGVTPYTSSYEFAGSCVFGKQSPEILSLRPPKFLLAQKFWREALLLTYGRFFAEFLNEDSPVPLRLLASSTSVGLRYGFSKIILRNFSWKTLQSNFRKIPDFINSRICHWKQSDWFTGRTILKTDNVKPIRRSILFSSSFRRILEKDWNINQLSISCGFRYCLRTA